MTNLPLHPIGTRKPFVILNDLLPVKDLKAAGMPGSFEFGEAELIFRKQIKLFTRIVNCEEWQVTLPDGTTFISSQPMMSISQACEKGVGLQVMREFKRLILAGVTE